MNRAFVLLHGIKKGADKLALQDKELGLERMHKDMRVKQREEGAR